MRYKINTIDFAQRAERILQGGCIISERAHGTEIKSVIMPFS
jgi:hypothetical protein